MFRKLKYSFTVFALCQIKLNLTNNYMKKKLHKNKNGLGNLFASIIKTQGGVMVIELAYQISYD